jgi:hypothetical protein
MNRLFQTLRGMRDRPADENNAALAAFDNRIEVLTTYAERASAYEEDLTRNHEQILETLAQFHDMMIMALDAGKDRDALEYLRLAMRLRPQRDLLERELHAFRAVADELIRRITTLMHNLDQARAYVENSDLSPAASYYLDQTLNRLTRYFVLLERVSISRHKGLPQRLAEQMMTVIDDRQLDLELARFILSRRRALGTGLGRTES